MSSRPEVTGACAAAAASVFFGGMGFATRFVMGRIDPPIDPLTLAFARFAIGSLCLAPILLGYGLWVWALERTSPGRVAVFLALNPLAAAALGAILLHERITPGFAAGFVLVVLGILATNRPDPEHPRQ
jgi:drug/metabolite transporter (DMT)-like permease